jgi:hypothetical protein
LGAAVNCKKSSFCQNFFFYVPSQTCVILFLNFQVLSIQAVINAIAAIVIYKTIVQKRGSPMSYLIGYGVVMPALLAVPYELARWLGMRNMSMLVGFAASMAIVVFRCMMGKSYSVLTCPSLLLITFELIFGSVEVSPFSLLSLPSHARNQSAIC